MVIGALERMRSRFFKHDVDTTTQVSADEQRDPSPFEPMADYRVRILPDLRLLVPDTEEIKTEEDKITEIKKRIQEQGLYQIDEDKGIVLFKIEKSPSTDTEREFFSPIDPVTGLVQARPELSAGDILLWFVRHVAKWEDKTGNTLQIERRQQLLSYSNMDEDGVHKFESMAEKREITLSRDRTELLILEAKRGVPTGKIRGRINLFSGEYTAEESSDAFIFDEGTVLTFLLAARQMAGWENLVPKNDKQ